MTENMRRLTTIIMMAAALSSCSQAWTADERTLIESQGPVMRVLTIDNAADSAVLRQACRDLTARELSGAIYEMLAEKMIATVTDPSQDGVGIAGPQVGILRRVVAVQRFDKPGEPFEVYPNIRIVATRGEKAPGPEGCLSVPDEFVPTPGGHAEVERFRDIDIEYHSLASGRDTVETVQGFTAVIFQHECDHLDGTLFIDRISYPTE